MHRYEIQYTDVSDEGCPVFVWTCKAYDLEHAEEKFWEGPDSDGWKILSIKRVRVNA